MLRFRDYGRRSGCSFRYEADAKAGAEDCLEAIESSDECLPTWACDVVRADHFGARVNWWTKLRSNIPFSPACLRIFQVAFIILQPSQKIRSGWQDARAQSLEEALQKNGSVCA